MPKQGLAIQREIRDQPLQPAILVLELPQPARLIDLKAAVLRLPPIERLLADAVPSAELGRLAARSPAGILSRILTNSMAEFSGSRSQLPTGP